MTLYAPTQNLGLVMPGHGDFTGSWDAAAANPNYITIDSAVGSVAAIAVATTTPVALTAAQAANSGLSFTGTLSNDVVVNFPAGVGGRKMLFFGGLTFNGHSLYVRSPSDPTGVVATVPWAVPVSVFLWPGGRVYWDYGSAPIGTVVDFASGNSVPPGWQLCDGRAISRAQFDLLFAYLGTSYGAGDGSTTYNVPDLRGRVVAGADTMMGGASAGRLYGVGITWAYGEASHKLTIAEMPNHDHSFSQSLHSHAVDDQGHQHSGVLRSGGGGRNDAGYAQQTSTLGSTDYATTGISVTAAIANIAFAAEGGGTAHNNIQPTLTLNKLIRC